MSHPSFIDLDALHLGDVQPQVAGHVADCSECRAYVGRLSAPVEVPAWLARVRRPRWHLPLAAVAGLAVAASLAVVVALPSGVRAKSPPAVLVHARIDDRWTVWDGTTPFHRDDAVRFEVFAGPHRHVSIVDDGPRRVFDHRLVAGTREELPLVVGFSPNRTAEPVWLVLSEAPLDDATLFDAVARNRRDEMIWTVAITLPKEGP